MSEPTHTGKYWAWTKAGHLVEVARHGLPKDALLVIAEGPGGEWVRPVAGGGPAGEGKKGDR